MNQNGIPKVSSSLVPQDYVDPSLTDTHFINSTFLLSLFLSFSTSLSLSLLHIPKTQTTNETTIFLILWKKSHYTFHVGSVVVHTNIYIGANSIVIIIRHCSGDKSFSMFTYYFFFRQRFRKNEVSISTIRGRSQVFLRIIMYIKNTYIKT